MNMPSSIVLSLTFLSKHLQNESLNLCKHLKLAFSMANKKSKQSVDISGTSLKKMLLMTYSTIMQTYDSRDLLMSLIEIACNNDISLLNHEFT